MNAGGDRPEVVDIAFGLAAARLPADQAWVLRRAILAHLPWFADEPLAAIHPLKVAATAGDDLLLARRTRLLLRVPVAMRDVCLGLSGAVFALEAGPITIGTGAVRPLVAAATLAAQRVASSLVDGVAFEAAMADQLASLGVIGQPLAGRSRTDLAGDRPIGGFALTVHGLSANDSVKLQALGLGTERTLGWGIFVPAKTITVAPG